jgi:peptidoglycan/xylan/chitin deacetylase (PgdA/CDA1 family)
MPTLVSFTIDNLGDAADLQRGKITAPRPAGSNQALEQGYPALLELLASNGINATCFVEGWSVRQYPRQVQQLLGLGHQLGMHGWQHEEWAQLSNAEITELATRATDNFVATTGTAPLAFRAPGGKSTPFTNIVLAKLGYQIDASFTESGVISQLEPELVSIPFEWSGVDATHWLWNSSTHAEVDKLWQTALHEAVKFDSHFVFIWHPHIMGIDAQRLATGARIIRYIRNNPQFRIVPLDQMASTRA